MILQLDNIYEDDFLRTLIAKRIRPLIIASINDKKLIRFDELFQNIEQLKDDNGDVIITAREVIEEGAKNLKWHKKGNKVIITINTVKKIDGSFAKLIDICKLINNGSIDLNLQGYPIFTQSFSKIKENIDGIYTIYKHGGL